jgi:hypothetical protein
MSADSLYTRVIAPSGPTRTTKSSAVIAIGVDRHRVGCDNGIRWHPRTRKEKNLVDVADRGTRLDQRCGLDSWRARC